MSNWISLSYRTKPTSYKKVYIAAVSYVVTVSNKEKAYEVTDQ